MNDELPLYVEQAVEKIRRQKPHLESEVERYLGKWREAPPEERERIERLLLALSKPNRAAAFFATLFSLIGLALAYHFYSEFELEARVANGKRAIAKVERLSEGFCFFGSKGSKCVELELEVFDEKGSPFRATLTRSLSTTRLARVQPGSYVTVSLDAESQRTVYLDEKALESSPPEPPESVRKTNEQGSPP